MSGFWGRKNSNKLHKQTSTLSKKRRRNTFILEEIITPSVGLPIDNHLNGFCPVHPDFPIVSDFPPLITLKELGISLGDNPSPETADYFNNLLKDYFEQWQQFLGLPINSDTLNVNELLKSIDQQDWSSLYTGLITPPATGLPDVGGAIGTLPPPITLPFDPPGGNLNGNNPVNPTPEIQPRPYDFPVQNQPLIGVIDTGFSGGNPDINYSRVILGSDRIDNDNNPLLGLGEGNEHGSHILGIIGATQGNGIGINGINDDAKIWVGRGIGSGHWADSLKEFVDAAVSSGQPNAVVNLSLDLTQINPDGSVTTRYELTPQERAAIEYARQNHVLIVAAAGNDGGVMSVLGQASQEFDNIITVGASDGNNRAAYSSYGRGLDILAAGGTSEKPELSTVGDGLGTMAGTSVATAKVTGAASLVWAANPGLNYRQVVEILKSTAMDLGVPGWDVETGAGLLDIKAAVEKAKVTTPTVYNPKAFLTPNTWGGDGIVTPEERAVSYTDDINNEYQAMGWLLGNSTGPIAGASNSPQGTSGLWQSYSAGTIHWTPQYGAVAIWLDLQREYNDLGGSGSWLGFPTRREYDWNGGKRTDFEGGYIYWDGQRAKAYHSWEMPVASIPDWQTAINNEYQAMGWLLGNPTGPIAGASNSPQGTSGLWQSYSAGTIHWTSQYGAVALWLDLQREYNDLGGSGSWLGFPTRREYDWNGGKRTDFEGGYIYWDGQRAKAYHSWEMPVASIPDWQTAINNEYQAMGWLLGNSTGPIAGAGNSPQGTSGLWQSYSAGTIHWTSQYGAVALWLDLQREYNDLGGSGSWLGFPTRREYDWNGGKRTDFEGGYIYWDGQRAKAYHLGESPQTQSSPEQDIAQKFLYAASLYPQVGNAITGVQDQGGGVFRQEFERAIMIWNGQQVTVYETKGRSASTTSPSSTPQVNNPSGFTPVVFTLSVGVDTNYGIRLRTDTNLNAPGEAVTHDSQIEFDGWKYGEPVQDRTVANGQMDALWYRIKGTNYWIPSAFINGYPPGYQSPASSGGNTGNSGGVAITPGNGGSPPITSSSPTPAQPVSGKGVTIRTGGTGLAAEYNGFLNKISQLKSNIINLKNDWWGLPFWIDELKNKLLNKPGLEKELAQTEEELKTFEKKYAYYINISKRNWSDIQWENALNSSQALDAIRNDTDKDLRKLYTDICTEIFGSYVSIGGAYNSYEYYEDTLPKGGFGLHGGIDMSAGWNVSAKSVVDGTVVWTEHINGVATGYGDVTIKDNKTGRMYIYRHLNSSALTKGDPVKPGQEVGKVGKTGANFTHLHYEVVEAGKNERGEVVDRLYEKTEAAKQKVREQTANPLQDYWNRVWLGQ